MGSTPCTASVTRARSRDRAHGVHLRGLVAKIPRSRRWRVTELGHAVMSAAIQLREEGFPAVFPNTAA
jgi:hypothetical protein